MSLKDLKRRLQSGEGISYQEFRELQEEKVQEDPASEEAVVASSESNRGHRHREKPLCKKPDPRRFQARRVHAGNRR